MTAINAPAQADAAIPDNDSWQIENSGGGIGDRLIQIRTEDKSLKNCLPVEIPNTTSAALRIVLEVSQRL
ncbi:protein of unknown function [Acidithiobacillus ferrivorans]|uniref:Uncharacterized protein n=1 Tax=Acidithiobacillus ferrivorans TaxID=160808 RepID=A0A060US17_9PROT|nr:hypothetical protein [Acidithiobacillus ferrivorans]OCB01324.1 hypothetical protein BBC27_04525 [Acidithiobacillus ferrivorans]CDQ11407.1 hypothetical protein AFERRI_530302 [Acidithiobacillus ferrivorans]SMH67767.1 protein of unknown function [Acidithiobacillus ferrivorans]